jgi:hypothetical protein
MGYIERKDGELICTHPKVEKVWQYGVGNINNKDEQFERCISFTCIIMKDGTRKEFQDLKESFDEAEKYLQTIN